MLTVGTDRAGALRVGPRWLYPAKAAVTRARSLSWLALNRRRPAADGLRILYYHRVAEDRDELAVSPRQFRLQMDYLEREGFRAISVAEAPALIERQSASDRVVVLSFDDGFLDVAENALPELEQRGFRATVFVATGVVEGTARFSWYRNRQPPVLGWSDIVELDQGGTLEFEAHTVTHPNLLTVEDDVARFEIEESKRTLEQKLGRRVDIFCYPAGRFGRREERLVREAGFRFATSCDPGVNTAATNPFALRRLLIDRRDRLLDFRAKLLGGHDRELPFQRLYRARRSGPQAR